MRVFNETQRFTQWWLWLLLLVPALSVIGKPILTWIQSDAKLNTTLYIEFYIGCGTLFLVVLLFILFKLKITIDERGLSYQFFPIHFKPKLITWEQVDKIGIRTCKSFMEYGGWGYRLEMGGKAMNVKGNKGIQIKLKNGDSLLLGTQKMKEGQALLNRYFKKDEGI